MEKKNISRGPPLRANVAMDQWALICHPTSFRNSRASEFPITWDSSITMDEWAQILKPSSSIVLEKFAEAQEFPIAMVTSTTSGGKFILLWQFSFSLRLESRGRTKDYLFGRTWPRAGQGNSEKSVVIEIWYLLACAPKADMTTHDRFRRHLCFTALADRREDNIFTI